MRIAWFSPLPPERSGIADLQRRSGAAARAGARDRLLFRAATARDFLWKARRDPYDLVVYQLGNAPCHDYMWGYLAAFPGLVVLHDARLHHARARALLQQERFDDYRREFWYDHPDARARLRRVRGRRARRADLLLLADAARRDAHGAAGRGPQPARRRRSARGVSRRADRGDPPRHRRRCVGGRRGAARACAPALGVPDDAVLFAAFGKITAEKRIGAILRAFDAVARERARRPSAAGRRRRRTIRRSTHERSASAHCARAST